MTDFKVRSYPAVATSSQPADVAKQDTSKQLALMVAEAADDRKGADIVILKVSEVSYLADYFVLVTGFSSVQVRAIARSIEDKVEEESQRFPLRTEGQGDGTWMVQDYGDVIAHIFMPEQREFYNLEAFWGHAEKIEFSTLAKD
ncbi:ribosome silencing factor [Trichocoleus desertorum]|nr:ribosome silencing factor [Trichocoleus sp. FACHB-46]MBD2098795.1 ribosome silencing factor [Trichocoleus sp. FACHB-591]MBD2121965.1 ribosome silencing factor [Trichocoleus sp. FACHB-262]